MARQPMRWRLFESVVLSISFSSRAQVPFLSLWVSARCSWLIVHTLLLFAGDQLI